MRTAAARKAPSTPLTAQYGEPTTYPGLENRISTHLDRLSTDAVGSGEVYNEYWSVSENCDASLGVSFLPDGRLLWTSSANPANVILVSLKRTVSPEAVLFHSHFISNLIPHLRHTVPVALWHVGVAAQVVPVCPSMPTVS